MCDHDWNLPVGQTLGPIVRSFKFIALRLRDECRVSRQMANSFGARSGRRITLLTKSIFCCFPFDQFLVKHRIANSSSEKLYFSPLKVSIWVDHAMDANKPRLGDWITCLMFIFIYRISYYSAFRTAANKKNPRRLIWGLVRVLFANRFRRRTHHGGKRAWVNDPLCVDVSICGEPVFMVLRGIAY